MNRILVMLLIIAIFLTSCSKPSAQKPEALPAETPLPSASVPEPVGVRETHILPENLGDDLPVSRAMIAKTLALIYADKNTLRATDREIKFTDTTPDKWYDKYINYAFIQGIIAGFGEDEYKPEAPLNISQAQALIKKLNPDTKINLVIDDENKAKPISYALWMDLYLKLLNELKGDGTILESLGIAEQSFIVLATQGNSDLTQWKMITDKGPYSHEGINMDYYVDMEVSALVRDNEVVGIISVKSQSPIILNTYIVRNDNDSITIFSGGAERTYKYRNSLGDVSGKICDIRITGKDCDGIFIYDKVRTGVIKRVTKDFVELEEDGIITLEPAAKFYSALPNEDVRWKRLSDLIVGEDIAQFFIKDETISAAVITKKATPEKIRVAINNSEFNNLYHKDVIISGQKDFIMRTEGQEKTYKAGSELKLDSSLKPKSRIYVESEGKLEIRSVKRSLEGSPAYHGSLEIICDDQGYIIVNEVDLEKYLYSVVPSEMPASYGQEALQVQAIAARTYAYRQYYANSFHNYGANIDDSVISQVYNNISETSQSIQAVDETRGKYLSFEGEIITANFFSTSCGMTANSGEVWPNSETKEFPTYSPKYLRSVKQFSGNQKDLSKEDAAAGFLKAPAEGYDSGVSWHRWKVTMGYDELSAGINASIASRYAATPFLIKTLQPNGAYRSRAIESIGELKDLSVTRRSKAGNIIELKLEGTEATVLVQSEYNIRTLLSPKQRIEGRDSIVLERMDKTAVDDYSLMPSAFFVIEKDTEAGRVTFFGGGNGHGVGMSQNGAKAMLEQGFGVEEVLKNYYQGAEILVMESSES